MLPHSFSVPQPFRAGAHRHAHRPYHGAQDGHGHDYRDAALRVQPHESLPSLFFGEAVLMMELPKRHSTPSEGGRFAPINSSDYGGRPLTGPRPDDLLELRLAEWSGWVNE